MTENLLTSLDQPKEWDFYQSEIDYFESLGGKKNLANQMRLGLQEDPEAWKTKIKSEILVLESEVETKRRKREKIANFFEDIYSYPLAFILEKGIEAYVALILTRSRKILTILLAASTLGSCVAYNYLSQSDSNLKGEENKTKFSK